MPPGEVSWGSKVTVALSSARETEMEWMPALSPTVPSIFRTQDWQVIPANGSDSGVLASDDTGGAAAAVTGVYTGGTRDGWKDVSCLRNDACKTQTAVASENTTQSNPNCEKSTAYENKHLQTVGNQF